MRKRLKEICDYISRGATPDYVDESPNKVMNQATFSKGFIDESNVRFSSKAPEYAQIHKGDLLMASTGGGVLGKVAYYDKNESDFYADSHVSILRNSKGKNSMKFLYYWFSTRYDEINETMVKGSTNQTELQRNYLVNYEIDIPSLEVQQRIVSYLDDKTAKIDKAVSLLQKKRDAYTRLKTSIINRAVTRGLNTNVKLKDSGVDWIGMIPENWIIRRFKEVFSHYTTGFTPESKNAKNFEGQNTWITIADMTHKYVSESNLYLSDEAIQKAQQPITPKGSLLFSFKLSIGKVAFAGKNVYTNEAIVSLMPSNRYNLNFFYYYLPIVCLNNATENIYGAKMLNQKIISNMIFAVPPKEEQLAIADYLDTHCSRIDHAISIVDKQIDAYTRLKKSLINEVVTGKRKV